MWRRPGGCRSRRELRSDHRLALVYPHPSQPFDLTAANTGSAVVLDRIGALLRLAAMAGSGGSRRWQRRGDRGTEPNLFWSVSSEAVAGWKGCAVSVGLLALLDDVAFMVRSAAASLDDVAAQAARAGTKAAGVVIDDAAVTPRYVVGFAAERELPIVGKIAWARCATSSCSCSPAPWR